MLYYGPFAYDHRLINTLVLPFFCFDETPGLKHVLGGTVARSCVPHLSWVLLLEKLFSIVLKSYFFGARTTDSCLPYSKNQRRIQKGVFLSEDYYLKTLC